MGRARRGETAWRRWGAAVLGGTLAVQPMLLASAYAAGKVGPAAPGPAASARPDRSPGRPLAPQVTHRDASRGDVPRGELRRGELPRGDLHRAAVRLAATIAYAGRRTGGGDEVVTYDVGVRPAGGVARSARLLLMAARPLTWDFAPADCAAQNDDMPLHCDLGDLRGTRRLRVSLRVPGDRRISDTAGISDTGRARKVARGRQAPCVTIVAKADNVPQESVAGATLPVVGPPPGRPPAEQPAAEKPKGPPGGKAKSPAAQPKTAAGDPAVPETLPKAPAMPPKAPVAMPKSSAAEPGTPPARPPSAKADAPAVRPRQEAGKHTAKAPAAPPVASTPRPVPVPPPAGTAPPLPEPPPLPTSAPPLPPMDAPSTSPGGAAVRPPLTALPPAPPAARGDQMTLISPSGTDAGGGTDWAVVLSITIAAEVALLWFAACLGLWRRRMALARTRTAASGRGSRPRARRR
ncbi:hypothetical protein [Actinomadura macrotermitis]|uniref:hypothetical protein n=1 Tax=Actinomadura macrotermitis TaxID=2585200 RepID=UPI001296A176|nr:hypothetical protein [Actinomadura macrotermitis]